MKIFQGARFRKGRSLSDLVENYLRTLSSGEDPKEEISPRVKRLVGSIKLSKNVVDKDLILSKVKSPNENFYVWKMVNPDSETIEELNEKPQGHTAEVWQAAKKWSKRNKECN